MIVSGSLYKKEVDLEALVYQFAEWWRTILLMILISEIKQISA